MGTKLSIKSRPLVGKVVSSKRVVKKYSQITLTILTKEDVEAGRSSAYDYVLQFDLKGYQFFYGGIGKRNDFPLLKEHKYRFTSSKNIRYHVIVEHYEYDLFAVKFYVKNHEGSRYKYNLLTRNYDARRIIYTCVEIAKTIQEKYPLASFGFVGSPTKTELKTTKFNDTKRFKVYTYFANFFFNPEHFEHAFDKSKSTYIILNKAKVDEDNDVLNKIVTLFEKHYNIEGIHAAE